MNEITFCSQCGVELAASSVFCSKCGTRLAKAPIPIQPGLPSGWQQAIDPKSRKTYYISPEGQSQWENPAAQPPSSSRAKYDHRRDLFAATLPQMVRLAVRAVNDVGYKLGDVNETIGIVQFETGISWGSWSGVSCTLTMEEHGDNLFTVRDAGKQNLRGGQLIAVDLFGESKKRAQKVIRRMAELAR